MTTHQLAALFDHIRNGFGDGLKSPLAAELEEIAAVFRELPDQKLKELVKQLRKTAAPAPTKGKGAATVDPKSVDQGVRLYNELLADRTLSIADVRVGFEPLRAHSKPVLEEISRRLGYTPVGSKPAILDRLLENLEGIKLSQHRADRILAGTGS